MLKNKRRMSLAGVSVIFILIALVFVFGKYEFSVTQEEAQEKITEVLPIEKEGITITKVQVDFPEEGDVTKLHAEGSVTRFGRTYTFLLEADGVPEYQFTKGAFYFRPSEVQIVSLEQTGGESVAESVSRVAQAARRLFPQRTGVIDELESAGEKVAPQVQAWLESKAEYAAVYVLRRAPIYTLPNDVKGFAAQAVLDDIVIINDTLTVKLSLYRLGAWVLIFAFGALLAIGLMMSPWAMAGGLVIGSF